MKIPAGDCLSIGGKLLVIQKENKDDGEESGRFWVKMKMAEVEGLKVGAKKKKRLFLVLWIEQMADAGLKEGGKSDGKVEDVSK